MRRLAAALYALPSDHPAAQKAKIFGYTLPSDYGDVDALMRALRLPPYDQAPLITWRDIWATHAGWISTLAATFVAIVFLLVLLIFNLRRLQQQNLSLEQASRVFHHAQEAILVTDPTGKILKVNPAFTLLVGYPPQEVVGKSPDILRSERDPADFYQKIWQELTQKGYWRGEILARRKDGLSVPTMATISAVHDADGRICQYVALYLDITAEKNKEAELRYLAYYDPLTGLANRHYLLERLTEILANGSHRSPYFLSRSGSPQPQHRAQSY